MVSVVGHWDLSFALVPDLVCAHTRKIEFKARILNCIRRVPLYS